MKRNVLLAILAVLAVCVCAGVYFYLQEDGCLAQTSAKPVIYLYPREETNVDVTLDYDGRLTCTYPKYTGGWSVTARPDGTLTDGAGQSYNYLYWEGEDRNEYDFSRGFCVAGADSAAFRGCPGPAGPHPAGGQRIYRLLAAPAGREPL